jgi:hypothetical protein
MSERKRKQNQITRTNFMSQLLLIELDDNLEFDKFNEQSHFISYRDPKTKSRFRYFPGVQKRHRLNDNSWSEVGHQEFIQSIRRQDLFGNYI